MIQPRKVTVRILEAADEGTLSWQQIAEAAMRAMSEDDVALMAHNEEFFLDDQYDDEDEEE